jgi:hypothetical protein
VLGRATAWRQGHLLVEEDAATLDLLGAGAVSRRVVVISHDCDLAHAKEAFVEVIVGETIHRADGNFIGAKNPRCLHLRYNDGTANALCVELRYANRREIPASRFSQLEAEDSRFSLADDERRVLQQWLAARYGRAAFPNKFEEALRVVVQKKTVEDRIASITAGESVHLVGLFFDLGENRYRELPPGEPYDLGISVVYDTSRDAVRSREAAEKVASEISALCLDAFGKPHDAKLIAIENCAAVADTHFSLADLRRVDQWRLEYVSLRQNPAGEFVGPGAFTI